MNNRTKGALAGIVGVALLAGGSTFALWNDTATTPGGVITAGNLDVAVVGSPTWVDTSPDRTDAGHPIDLGSFRIVPGDTVVGTFGIDAALQGDNLVADLEVTTASHTVQDLRDQGLSVKYTVKRGSTVIASDIAMGTATPIRFASADNSNNVAALPTLGSTLDGAADVTVEVSATFAAGTSGQTGAGATAALGDLGVSLTQSRTAGVGGGF